MSGRPANVFSLPGCHMGSKVARPPYLPGIRWWMVCEGGEWLLVYHMGQGRWQECFDGWTSKGVDRVFSREDYTGPWRPILNVFREPYPVSGQPLDGVQA